MTVSLSLALPAWIAAVAATVGVLLTFAGGLYGWLRRRPAVQFTKGPDVALTMLREDGYAGWYLSFAVENLSTVTDRLDAATIKLGNDLPIPIQFQIPMPAPIDQYHVLTTYAQTPSQLVKFGDVLKGELAFEFRRAGIKRRQFAVTAERPRA